MIAAIADDRVAFASERIGIKSVAVAIVLKRIEQRKVATYVSLFGYKVVVADA